MCRLFCINGWIGILLTLILCASLVMPARGGEMPVTIWAGDPSQHAVALTFDDGPSLIYTPKILALLQRYHAHATFFVLGDHLEKYPKVVRAALLGGNEVGNHSFSHPRFTKVDQSIRERELEGTSVDLDLVGCPKTERLFRPPYSAFDERLSAYLAHTQRHLVLWSIDSGDWKGLDAATIAKNVLSRVRNGAIIIFHDSNETGKADRRPTLQALEMILPILKAAGYRMVTVSELFSHSR